MYIDVGAPSAEAVAAMGIGVGDAVEFVSDVVAFGPDGSLVAGKAIDNRFQVATFTGGNNDATSMAWSGKGVPAASLCLPRRYAHSPTEVADMRDSDATLQLLQALVARMDDLPGFGFLDGP